MYVFQWGSLLAKRCNVLSPLYLVSVLTSANLYIVHHLLSHIHWMYLHCIIHYRYLSDNGIITIHPNAFDGLRFLNYL